MADEPNSPANTPGRAAGRNQRTPSATQGQQKRNNRNRKNANNHITDGTVSDGALANPAVSPQLHRTRQSVAMGAVQGQQTLNPGRASAQKARPVSVGSNMISNMAEQAYAGPTFQASPAASALPVPKFFSKSVPNIGVQPSLQGRMAGEKTPEEQASSPESDRVSPVPLRQAHSPLDLFFKADRAEKQRTQSGGHLQSPEISARPHPATAPRNFFQQGSRNALLRELDGDDSDLPSPRTMPSKSRPPAVERAHSSPGVPVRPTSDADRDACTRSLKNLLFDTSSASPTSTPRKDSFTPDAAFGAQSPFYRVPSGPTTPQGQTDQNPNYHYGNRNLSPLFKAARDTPARPSSLRQEMAPNGPDPPYNPRPQSRDFDHSVARSYLDEQIRASAPAEMPPFRPVSSSGNGSVPIPVQQGYSSHRPTSTSSTTPRTGGSRDIRTMEDDLRRMLKLET
jgi:hypothetical protein